MTEEHLSPRHVEIAQRKTDKVREELEIAGAELGLAHDALEDKLPEESREPDVQWAIGQSAAVEEKLGDAAEELAEVRELLDAARAERDRLEEALARRA
jgi:hypothetical protein